MRYVLQEWEIPIELPSGQFTEHSLGEVRRRFLEAHKGRYGFAREDKAIEFVALSVKAVVPASHLDYGVAEEQAESNNGLRGVQPVVIDQALPAVEVPVYAREALHARQPLDGPFVITEPTSTVFVQPGWRAHADRHGNLIATAA